MVTAQLDKELRERALKDKDIFYSSLNVSLRDEDIYLQAATYDENKVEIYKKENESLNIS